MNLTRFDRVVAGCQKYDKGIVATAARLNTNARNANLNPILLRECWVLSENLKLESLKNLIG